jgi:hypothetical protein
VTQPQFILTVTEPEFPGVHHLIGPKTDKTECGRKYGDDWLFHRGDLNAVPPLLCRACRIAATYLPSGWAS